MIQDPDTRCPVALISGFYFVRIQNIDYYILRYPDTWYPDFLYYYISGLSVPGFAIGFVIWTALLWIPDTLYPDVGCPGIE